uniref:Uncharacterized protein n=1 Tax=Arundo donax TaxID=35708 RepID=A0A0A9AI90_ARUDO
MSCMFTLVQQLGIQRRGQPHDVDQTHQLR